MVNDKHKDIISELTGEDLKFFYNSLMRSLGVSRHASCEIQIKAVLTGESDLVEQTLINMGKVEKDE
jgi:hypothetical protein